MYRLHMSNPSVARQMDPPDNKQIAESNKLLHLLRIHCITQTTLPSPAPPNTTGWPPVSEQALVLNLLWRATMQDLTGILKGGGSILLSLSYF